MNYKFLFIFVVIFFLFSCTKENKNEEDDVEQITSATTIIGFSGELGKLLDDYEEFIDEYVSLLLRSQDGVAVAAARMSEYHAEYQRWVLTIQHVEEAFRNRLDRISRRIDNVLEE